MFDEHTLETWKRAGAGAAPLGREELERMLQPSVRRTGRALTNTLIVYLVVPLATAVLAGANVSLFAGNTNMVALELSLAVLAATFAAYSFALVLRLRRGDALGQSLVESLRARLDLYERSFGAWILTACTAPWLLSMAINTRIDGSQGTWRVNHPVEFVIVSAVMLGITYVGLRIALRSTVFEMRATLQDLLAEALEATPRVTEVRRRSRGWMLALTLLLVLSVAAALWLWWSHSSGAQP
jgi:hypothetical protein